MKVINVCESQLFTTDTRGSHFLTKTIGSFFQLTSYMCGDELDGDRVLRTRNDLNKGQKQSQLTLDCKYEALARYLHAWTSGGQSCHRRVLHIVGIWHKLIPHWKRDARE